MSPGPWGDVKHGVRASQRPFQPRKNQYKGRSTPGLDLRGLSLCLQQWRLRRRLHAGGDALQRTHSADMQSTRAMDRRSHVPVPLHHGSMHRRVQPDVEAMRHGRTDHERAHPGDL